MMALKLKYTDEHGILHINMSPTSSPRLEENRNDSTEQQDPKTDITDPKFDTINNRFAQYDLFGGKYDVEIGGETQQSLFRSRYNSIEEELANTPYAFATERSLRLNTANNNPVLDITIKSRASADDASPSRDIEDDRFFNRNLSLEYDDTSSLFGPQLDFLTKSTVKTSDEEDSPAFTVTQLIHAQDRYFDLSSRQSSSVIDSPKAVSSVKSVPNSKVKSLTNSFQVRSAPGSAKKERTVKIAERFGSVKPKAEKDEAFKVLSPESGVKAVQKVDQVSTTVPAVPTSKKKRETSFAILAERPASRPTSPRSLPLDTKPGRVSPFKGRGFREDTSRHNTPKTSAANSRASSPPRRRTNSLSRIDKMAQAATLPPPVHTLSRPHSPRNFLKENIEEVRELSELNREKHEAEAETKRKEEEEALLIEMGLLNKNAKSDAIRSVVGSRTNSRSNSPSKINLRSRSNSPAAIVHYENIAADSKDFINPDDGMPKPVTHKSRVRSISRSQPQSNNGSPKNSKIPKRQSSVSPIRNTERGSSNSRKPPESNLNKQRFISNSTSSIHETIRVGSQVHDKRAISKSTQHLSISPAHIKGKPPISPGRGGPPPSNRSISTKRLSPIVGTPNRSPIENLKPKSAKTPIKPSPAPKKPIKTAGNTPATSRLNSRQPSRTVSRDPSPEKRKNLNRTSTSSKPATSKTVTKPINRTPSTRNLQKPTIQSKPEPKKPINRTSSMKSLTRTPSTKTLNEIPPLLKKRDSKKDLKEKAHSTSTINELGTRKNSIKNDKKPPKGADKGKDTKKASTKDKKEQNIEEAKVNADSATDGEEVTKQDNETQYDSITNEKGELVILTKKNIVSMTTAAITAQPLEVVTTVTNQLPAALEKAREKRILERLSSKDSLAPKEENNPQESADKKETIEKTDLDKKDVTSKDTEKNETTATQENAKEKSETKGVAGGNKNIEDKEKNDDKKNKNDPKHNKNHHETSTLFNEDNIKLRLLQPPYNNPQVERVKQKIDDILKAPEVSTENILTPTIEVKESKKTFKNVADKTKTDIKDTKHEIANKLTEIKDKVVKENEKMTAEIRSEATKIVDSIITPVEEPKEIQKPKEEIKKNIEPIVMVVNEKKKNGPNKSEVIEKINETLVKGEPEVEVQSSNMSTPVVDEMAAKKKMADGNGSDKSAQSNGGFPQSTSTTPKPPARAHRNQQKEEKTQSSNDPKELTPESEKETKKPNICSRLLGKCKTKCCPCCVQSPEDEKETKDVEAAVERKSGMIGKFNCCKKKEKEVDEKIKDVERAAEKAATIEFENEIKHKRSFRDAICCCGRGRRVSDVSDAGTPRAGDVAMSRRVAGDGAAPGVAGDTGCCGKKRPDVERRDSILSDQPPATCGGRLRNMFCGACRKQSEHSSSRRTSMFSKNKSLSPTLPPEDTRTKLDTSLVEHTSVMRAAIPVLPIVLAYFCLICNVIVPGLGTIFSGMFCLCFGIPRFGVHDGAKHRIGSFVINLLVGCGQLFTVLFCLVGWGWSIWWGVIMLKISRKYRKLRAETAAEEAEAAPPVTANNHTRA